MNIEKTFKLIIVNTTTIEEFFVNEILIESSSVGAFSILKGHQPTIVCIEDTDVLTIFLEDASVKKMNHNSGFFQVDSESCFFFI